MSKKEKVFFVQKIDVDKFETESLWCISDHPGYIIDNIPFVAKRVALGDKIKVELDEEENVLYFDDFISVSGNSTIRVYFETDDLIESVRKELRSFGCDSEVFLARKIIAINVPKNINYAPIKQFLETGEGNKEWIYEEACLAHRIKE